MKKKAMRDSASEVVHLPSVICFSTRKKGILACNALFFTECK